MRSDDLLQKLKKQPFVPFRVFLSDGSQYDVRHPELAIVTRRTVVIGVPGSDGPEGPMDKTVDCSLMHVTRLEQLDAADNLS